MSDPKKQYSLKITRQDVNEHGEMTSVKETVLVTEDIYRAYMRPVWVEQKRCEREKRCRGEKGVRCQGDCATCKFLNEGGILSLDQMTENGKLPAGYSSLEEEVTEKELYQALYAAISSLDMQDQLIVALFLDGKTEREIKEYTKQLDKGIKSQKGINNRKKHIFAKLKKLLKDYQ